MSIKVMGLILSTLIISGCATGANKQPAYQVSSQTYQQNSSSLDYEDVQPAKTTIYSTLAPTNLSAKQIQRALKSAGFYQGSIDGKIGSKTREAIIKFQKANGLKADGIVGKKTSVELSKVKPL
jgi:peptidoglycan hydrolase-like protein with peptidoglycan-binding domain